MTILGPGGPEFGTLPDLTPRTPAGVLGLPVVEVYVDETGDRGISAAATQYFAMNAVMVPAESVPYMRVIVKGLRQEIGLSEGKPLHWVDHFRKKHNARRALASALLATLPGAKVVYVVVNKDALQDGSGMRADGSIFYNYTTRLLLERVAKEAAGWSGGPRRAIARLGTVRGMDHDATAHYLSQVYRTDRTTPWQNIQWPPKWYGTNRFEGIQVADLYLGMLRCAIEGDPGDVACARFLLQHKHQVRRNYNGSTWGWGFKVYAPNRSWITARAWWDDFNTPPR